MGAILRNYKNLAKFLKSDSQGIGRNFRCHQDVHDSLNQFQFLEIKKSFAENIYADS